MPCQKKTLAFFLIALGLLVLATGRAKAQTSTDRIAPEVAASTDAKPVMANRAEVDPKTPDRDAPRLPAIKMKFWLRIWIWT